MNNAIKLISTDFDGTLFAEFENPPVPQKLQNLIGSMQERGVKWVINTGRDLSSLMEALGRSKLSVQPDFLVLVEREIYCHENSQFIALHEWNLACTRAHEDLFKRVRPDIPKLTNWISHRFAATIYEDAYSPFCLIAGNNGDADVIHDFLEDYCKKIPDLSVVRNDVYARFSHSGYNKGTALSQLARMLQLNADSILAAGDHFNDLPMLSSRHARWLVAPANAIEPVKQAVRNQNGYLSQSTHGHGIAEGLEYFLSLRTT